MWDTFLNHPVYHQYCYADRVRVDEKEAAHATSYPLTDWNFSMDICIINFN